MDVLFTILIRSEYVTSLFIASIIFIIWMPKRKHWYLPFFGGFLLMQGLWYVFDVWCKVIEPFNYVIMLVLFLFTIYGSFDLNLKNSLFLTTCTYASQHAIFKITIIFVFLFGGRPIWMSFWYFLIYFIVESLLSLAFYFGFARKFKYNPNFEINRHYLFMASIVVLLALIFLSYYSEKKIFELDDFLILFIEFNLYGFLASIAVLVINFVSIQNSKLIEENAALELLFKKDEERYKVAKKSAELIGIKYHDLKKMMNNNNHMSGEDKDEIISSGKKYESLYYTGCKALDLLLTEKKLSCDKNKIELFVTVDGKCLNFIKSFQIYSLFSNLFDNAIEGVKDIETPSLRYIKLKINRVRDNVVIVMENYTNHDVIFQNGLPLTTKKDKQNHGYGTKSIDAIVKKYNGYLLCDYTDNIFKTKIVFTYPNEAK